MAIFNEVPLLNLEKGEVVKYDSGSGTQYLIVDRIDTELTLKGLRMIGETLK